PALPAAGRPPGAPPGAVRGPRGLPPPRPPNGTPPSARARSAPRRRGGLAGRGGRLAFMMPHQRSEIGQQARHRLLLSHCPLLLDLILFQLSQSELPLRACTGELSR